MCPETKIYLVANAMFKDQVHLARSTNGVAIPQMMSFFNKAHVHMVTCCHSRAVAHYVPGSLRERSEIHW